MPKALNTMVGNVAEWSYTSGLPHKDPFNDVELDVEVLHESGARWTLPAFWSGGLEWRVRFAPPAPGRYDTRTSCHGEMDPTLDGCEAAIIAAPSPRASNPESEPPGSARSRTAAPHVAAGRLLDEDGKPFQWLGDTWWMGLSRRIAWPDEFQRLAADRADKGFTVVQLVAGLYPDMPAFDERAANEAGLAWEPEFARINPAYFDAADLKITWLVRSGLVPCIVGAWGYYLPILGIDRMKRHWRYLVARWSAYPVVFCLAGEATMPYYLSNDKARDREVQKQGWTEIGRYLRDIDPHRRLHTVHPTEIGRDQLEDDTVIDLDMLQTGHGGDSIGNLIDLVSREVARTPSMPVVVAEANYEGILHDSGAEHQRRQYWLSILNGAAGYTYGANGLWQASTADEPYGRSPHGASWGDATWEEAYRYSGASHIAHAAKLLNGLDLSRMAPYPEWVTADRSSPTPPTAAGVPRSFRLIYLYDPIAPWTTERPKVRGIEPGIEYLASFWNPRTGAVHEEGSVEADDTGEWEIPYPPTMTDWLLVLTAEE